eukprot:TRINITY_DN10996_c0_g1_i2.p1 TRINITY_DN10996_c0_g1~~TRINITY_DN10996_c0_g1_i2.p1  ORF type:complete len:780 (-),score=160.65 TRINITY_DN10996_c0_g1_i2:21-2360(-)
MQDNPLVMRSLSQTPTPEQLREAAIIRPSSNGSTAVRRGGQDAPPAPSPIGNKRKDITDTPTKSDTQRREVKYMRSQPPSFPSLEDDFPGTIPADPADFEHVESVARPVRRIWGKLIALNNVYQNIDLIDEKQVLLMGRHPGCDEVSRFPTDNRAISARHCRIERVEYGDAPHTTVHAKLTDLSTNGTFVNHAKIGKNQSIILSHRDYICLGSSPRSTNIDNRVVGYLFIDAKEAELYSTPSPLKRLKTAQLRTPPSVSVLYSVPLAYPDTFNQLQPMDLLDYANERELLCKSIQESKRGIPLRFAFATTERLRTLVTLGTRALHYSGHGSADYLSFEDGKGGVHLVKTDMLRELFAAGGTSGVEFVFVSACSSRPAGEAFLTAGVPHVVAVEVNTQLADVAARVFTRDFYLALAVGKTVSESYEIGKNAVRAAPIASAEVEADKFLLLPEDGDHNVPIFGDVAACNDWTAPSMEVPSNLPAVPEDFLGRNVSMFDVIRTVLSRRLVSVTGVAGVGKSALVIAVARYLNERGVFRDGIVHARLHGVKTAANLYAAIADSFSAYQNLFGPSPSNGSSVKLTVAAPIPAVQPTLEHLVSYMRARHTLLILDHCDSLLEHASSELVGLLAELLQAAGSMRVLLTSRTSVAATILQTAESQAESTSVPGSADMDDDSTENMRIMRLWSAVGEKVIDLAPLNSVDSARLFARRAPRRLTPEEVGAAGPRQLLSALSSHAVIYKAGGIPRRLIAAAARMQSLKLNELLATMTQSFVAREDNHCAE